MNSSSQKKIMMIGSCVYRDVFDQVVYGDLSISMMMTTISHCRRQIDDNDENYYVLVLFKE